MTLRIVFSNRLDALADRLQHETAADPLGVFCTETVVVPSSATGRWLQQRIATQQGVAANIETELAGRFVWRLFCALVPQLPERAPFEAAATAWPIFERLSDTAWCDRFDGLRGFGRNASERARYALARSLAAQFERYLLDRIDWLDRWQAGTTVAPAGVVQHRRAAFRTHEEWQADLWRHLIAILPQVAAEHPARSFETALARSVAEGGAAERMSAAMLERFGKPLPPRLAVFGGGARAPVHLRVLAALSRVIDVTFYVHNPCRQFWLDIVDESTRTRVEVADPEVALLFDVGHPLLASWGKAARDALSCLIDAVEAHEPIDQDDYRPPAGATQLAALQAAVLDLDLSQMRLAQRGDDASIQIHAAHTPLRQVEVLHDLLLDCFDALTDLSTDQVLVLVPEIETFAPFVTAVFEAQPPHRRIPYLVTARTPIASEAIEALLGLLSLATGAPTGADLMRLIEAPWMTRLLRLEQRELERVRHWIMASGLRRGVGGELQGATRHSWQAAIERLLMGAALDDDDQGFAGVAARGAASGTAADALDAVLVVVDVVQGLRRLAREPRSVARWSRVLHAVVDRLLEGVPREAAAEFVCVRSALDSLVDGARHTTPSLRVPLDVMLAALRGELADAPASVSANGAVCFAPPGALRGIGHRVIVWLGLDDGVFPRTRRAPEWDLMALAPRRGDRMHGIDDRGEFLDSLLAAGDRFVVLYTGRDLQTNEPLAPSVLVSELTEHLQAAWGDAALRSRQWPLHGFSPSLFRAEAPSSFAAELLEAARATAGATGGAGVVASTANASTVVASAPPASTPPASTPPVRRLPSSTTPVLAAASALELQSLVDFLRDPARAYARARLGINLPWEREEIPEDAPFLPTGLQRARLRERAVALAAAGLDAQSLADALALDPVLPEGAAGAAMARAVATQAIGLQRRVDRYGPARPQLQLELPLTATTLVGGVDGLRAGALVLLRIGAIRAEHLVDAWVRHLAVSALATSEELLLCTVVEPFDPGLDPVEFEPVASCEAHSILDLLVDTCAQGLVRPLALPVETAIAVARGESQARIEAAYHGSAFTRRAGDRESPWFRAVFGDEVPDLDTVVGPEARRVYAGFPRGAPRARRNKS